MRGVAHQDMTCELLPINARASLPPVQPVPAGAAVRQGAACALDSEKSAMRPSPKTLQMLGKEVGGWLLLAPTACSCMQVLGGW